MKKILSAKGMVPVHHEETVKYGFLCPISMRPGKVTASKDDRASSGRDSVPCILIGLLA